MKSFEAIFDVPAEHRLVLIKSRAVGGEAPAERWEHEEFDDQGKLVARYQSFVEIDPVMGTMRCGWYRYDADGFLSSWEEDLPDLVAALAPELAINLGQSAAYHSGQASRQFKRAR